MRKVLILIVLFFGFQTVFAQDSLHLAVIDTLQQPVTAQEKLIIDYIRENGSITDEEIQFMFDVKQTRVYVIIRSMKEKGIIVTKGRGNDKKHYLK